MKANATSTLPQPQDPFSGPRATSADIVARVGRGAARTFFAEDICRHAWVRDKLREALISMDVRVIEVVARSLGDEDAARQEILKDLAAIPGSARPVIVALPDVREAQSALKEDQMSGACFICAGYGAVDSALLRGVNPRFLLLAHAHDYPEYEPEGSRLSIALKRVQTWESGKVIVLRTSEARDMPQDTSGPLDESGGSAGFGVGEPVRTPEPEPRAAPVNIAGPVVILNIGADAKPEAVAAAVLAAMGAAKESAR